jgi:hypothetical protein
VAAKVNAEEYAPTTFNTWLAVLKVVLEHAKRDLELPLNAARDVVALDTTRHRVYTREEPNALTVEELRDFLACMHAKYPQYFAMTYTGFATGLRPSSLRPLRRGGPTPDIDWSEGDRLEEAHQPARDAPDLSGSRSGCRDPRRGHALHLRARDRGDAATLLDGQPGRAAEEPCAGDAPPHGLPQPQTPPGARWGGKWGAWSRRWGGSGGEPEAVMR